MKNATITTALLIFVFAGLCRNAIAEAVKSDEAILINEAKISRTSAEQKALEKIGGGTVFDSELERENGKLIYSFDISRKKLIKEVHVDAISGKVLSVKTESVKKEKKETSVDHK